MMADGSWDCSSGNAFPMDCLSAYKQKPAQIWSVDKLKLQTENGKYFYLIIWKIKFFTPGIQWPFIICTFSVAPKHN